MVDPINRFPCGVQYGDDITSFQCESIPYCCFNPIDETREVEDDEAVEMLDDPQGTKYFQINFLLNLNSNFEKKYVIGFLQSSFTI